MNFESQLKFLLEQLPGYVMWKGLDSRYKYCNDAFAKLLGFDSGSAAIGTMDADIPNVNTTLYELFTEQDQEVMKSGSKRYIDVLSFSQTKTHVLYTQKKCLYNEEHQCIGILLQAFELDKQLHSTVSDTLMNEYHYIQKNGIQIKSYEVSNELDLSVPNFSECETQILHYIIRGYTAKSIASSLNVAPKTVEGHLSRIKHKCNCKSKEDLIEWCFSTGVFFLVPGTLARDIM